MVTMSHGFRGGEWRMVERDGTGENPGDLREEQT
jgi:hypothetical protein